MNASERELAAKIEALHRQVRAQLDAAEDAELGEDVRGDDLPA